MWMDLGSTAARLGGFTGRGSLLSFLVWLHFSFPRMQLDVGGRRGGSCGRSRGARRRSISIISAILLVLATFGILVLVVRRTRFWVRTVVRAFRGGFAGLVIWFRSRRIVAQLLWRRVVWSIRRSRWQRRRVWITCVTRVTGRLFCVWRPIPTVPWSKKTKN